MITCRMLVAMFVTLVCKLTRLSIDGSQLHVIKTNAPHCLWGKGGESALPKNKVDRHSYLVLMYDVPVSFSVCPLIHVYKTIYPSLPLRCACGGGAERPQLVYANDNTRLIHQIKFRHNRYPWAHPLWFVECSSTWWPMHLWPGLPK